MIYDLKKLALTLPGGQTINSPLQTGPDKPIPEPTLGGIITGGINIALMAAGFLLFIWLVWGIYEYIFAGGNKEGLAKAQKRMTAAFIGFIILILAFALSQFAESVFPSLQQFNKATPITLPCDPQDTQDCATQNKQCIINTSGQSQCVNY